MLDAVVAVVKQQGVRPMSCREGEFKVGTVTVKKKSSMSCSILAPYTNHTSVQTWWRSTEIRGKSLYYPIVQWPDWQTSGRKLKPAR